MSDRNYSVTIVDSTVELSKRDKVKLVTSLHECTSINTVLLDNDDIIIDTPVGYVTLSIHNESSDEKDYQQYVIVTSDKQWYITGSNSLIESYCDIAEILEGEQFAIKIGKVASKNYKGKYFYRCSLV